MKRGKWGCSGCDRRWTSLTQAHCPVCHQQFAGMAAADRHRNVSKNLCRHPTKVGLVLHEESYGAVWRSPGVRPTNDQ